jgi:flagellar biosynthesis protein FliQ
MNETIFLDLLQQTVMMIILLTLPVLAVATAVGLTISLLQAVTQIQEATLTYVPKILASLLTLILASPWMLNLYIDHTQRLLRTLTTLTN